MERDELPGDDEDDDSERQSRPRAAAAPAVFHRLAALRPGARVRVLRADGEVAEFTVDDVRVVERDRFDARQAYGPHHPGRPELRLLSCAGAFDRATRTYAANVVVSAYLTGRG